MLKQLSTKLLLLIAIFLFGSFTVIAQSGTVSGTITDATDGTTLPGATVVIKGTAKGTATNMEGAFSLEIEPNTTLTFSYVGYTTQEMVVQPNTTIAIALDPEATGLNEIVVIGYGTQKKEDNTGAVTPISSKEFNQGAINTPANLIAGKVAGVSVISDGGAPGQGSQIRIRGGSSLSASNDPLFVVDGVPIDSEGVSGLGGGLSTLSPGDIETFTVLKDASATAIYGSRASNGVIIITTKKGKIGSPLSINYSGNFSFYTPTKKIDVLNADQFVNEMNTRFPGQLDMLGTWADSLGNPVNYNNLPENRKGYNQTMHNTNWQEEIFKNSFGQDHYLSLTGASKNTPYRVSIGYSNQDGILETDNYQRYTLGFAVGPSLLDDHLKINLNGTGSFVKNRFADRGAIGSAIQFDPTKPVYDSESPYSGYWGWLQSNGDPVSQATSNPVALLNLREDLSNVYRFTGNAQFDYKIHGFEELSFNLNLGIDYTESDGTIYVPEASTWEYFNGGVNNYYTQDKSNEVFDFLINYKKDVESIKSTFDVMVGYSWQHFWRSNYSNNSNIAGDPEKTETFDDRTESYLVSFFGRFNYTLMDQFLLTFTLRNDQTSRFSPETRSGLFPSAAFAWKINKVGNLKNSQALSQLKLRLGWGITGQQNINQGDYPYLPLYTASEPTAQYLLGNQYYITLRPDGYDANIKWEETTTYNAGIDFGFSSDRHYGSIDVYYRQTKDLLNFIPVPAGTNLTNFILTNIGDLENQGIEFSFFTRPVVRENVWWEIGFNASYNENKITKLTATDDPDYLGVETGGISGGVGNNIQIHSVGYPTSSFFVWEQVYDNQGNPIQGLYVDRNGDGEITNDDKYHFHKPAADFWFGLNSKVDFYNFEFAFSGRANFGNYVYNNVASENGVWERLYRPEGPYLSNIASYVYETNFQNPEYLSDYYIQDASFFKMDYISLSYIFRSIGNSRVNLRLSATVNNAFTITNYDGLDPEIPNGIDNNIYPRPRAYVFGVNLQF